MLECSQFWCVPPLCRVPQPHNAVLVAVADGPKYAQPCCPRPSTTKRGHSTPRVLGFALRFLHVLSEKVFGAQTNNRAEAMACLRVLQHLHRSRDLHVHTDSKWSHVLISKQYHDRQRRTSTRQKLIHCDIWATVYDVLHRRTGQML